MSNNVVYIASLSCPLDAFAESVSANKKIDKPSEGQKVPQNKNTHTQTHNDQAISIIILKCHTKEGYMSKLQQN